MASAVSDRKVPDRKSRRVTGRIPTMGETSYDIWTSAQIAAGLGLAGLVATLIAIWLSNLLPDVVVNTTVMEAGDGGFEDGSPDETLSVDSPLDPTDDPAITNDQDVVQLEQITEQVVAMSQTAVELTQPTEPADPSGNPGSAEGTGGRPYGTGGGRTGGAKREQRWFVEFADKGDLKSYAKQLDFFKIELGCAFKDGRMIYLKNVSGSPVIRTERLNSNDKRLFMNWQGGDRVKADIELFVKAGVKDAESGMVLHFYDPQTEQHLAKIELERAGGRPSEQIRRTYFQVKKAGSGYEFVVSSQKLR